MAAPMLQKRGALSVAVLGEQLVALGGWDGKGCAPPAGPAYYPRIDNFQNGTKTPLTPRNNCSRVAHWLCTPFP